MTRYVDNDKDVNTVITEGSELVIALSWGAERFTI